MHLLHKHRRIGFTVAAGIWMLSGSTVLVREVGQAAPSQGGRPFTRFHHVHINTVDPEASIKFYSAAFNEKKAKFAGTNAVRSANGWLLFTKVADALPVTAAAGFWHIGWGPADIKAYSDRLIKMGTPFQTPLTDMRKFIDPRQRYYAYVEGPGKEQIELFAESGSDQFEHLHMRASDPAVSLQWYLKYFVPPGQSNERPITPTTVGPPLWIDDIGFRWFRPAGGAAVDASRGHVFDHFAFAVDNLEAALARFQKDGVKVVEAPRTIFGGKVKSAFIADPDGVPVELVEDHTTTR